MQITNPPSIQPRKSQWTEEGVKIVIIQDSFYNNNKPDWLSIRLLTEQGEDQQEPVSNFLRTLHREEFSLSLAGGLSNELNVQLHFRNNKTERRRLNRLLASKFFQTPLFCVSYITE